MIKKIEKYIASQNLLPPKSTVVVGLSGGADSMALLDVLTLLDYRCIAAHCNFHLRGEESDGDDAFVKNWCKATDTEFTSIDFDTRQYAADKKISIEMAARELRYAWFEIVRRQYDADALAVAHHRDDSVETVLLNLIRGTGIRGLSGIVARNGKIVRPMLAVTRQEILQYVKEREIPFRSDSSNEQDVYLRNAIRLNVIPLLETLNPSVKEAIFRTSQNVGEAEKIYTEEIVRLKQAVFDGEKINISALRKTPSPTSLLFEILSPLGFTPSVIEDVSQSVEASSGKQFFSDKYRLIKDREAFILSEIDLKTDEEKQYPIPESTKEIIYPIHLKISKNRADVLIKKEPRCLYADADKLSFPLKLRRWQPGDWFVPFGMRGKKKLSDYFTDRKFSLADKENAWVLVSGDDIVWIVGERADERFRVGEDTKRVLAIELFL
ncbi:MAG: tRNA lysidine(34) synthetase TilS [Dysgonamonadaceae bacterium]|jgi:tRNA(Ile)-lysidine synthase|nr:tRNA lysidine(34) synthetase TilS [Dysgonamonadaceae bacterium]